MNKKIDIHVHVKLYKEEIEPGLSTIVPDEFRSIFEKLGIGKAVNLPSSLGEKNISRLPMNDQAHYISQKYPDMFYWFCNVNAKLADTSQEVDFTEYLAYYKGLGAKGVGEITVNIYFDEPLVDSLFSSCEKHNLPVIFHIGPMIGGGHYGLVDDLGLPRLERALAKFPNLKFLGHSQPFWAEISTGLAEEARNTYPKGKVHPGRLVELMKKYPNLCGDLSAYSGYNAMTRDPEFGYSFIEEFQDRLFYGTDINDPIHINKELAKLSAWLDDGYAQGKLSKIAYEKVCFGNALDLLEK